MTDIYEYKLDIRYYQPRETSNIFRYKRGYRKSYLQYCSTIGRQPFMNRKGTLFVYKPKNKIRGECFLGHRGLILRYGMLNDKDLCHLTDMFHECCREAQEKNLNYIILHCKPYEYLIHKAIEDFLETANCKLTFKVIRR